MIFMLFSYLSNPFWVFDSVQLLVENERGQERHTIVCVGIVLANLKAPFLWKVDNHSPGDIEVFVVHLNHTPAVITR